MRYIKKVGEQIIAYHGPAMGDAWYAAQEWTPYAGTLPVSRLDIIDGGIVELPDPGPSVEQIAWETREALMFRAAMLAIPAADDTTALALAPVCPEWRAGTHYEAGEVVNHAGQAYRVIQAVNALEHQGPGSEGMLAVYRPLNRENAGTIDDPIPWVYGMDVNEGKYYQFDGKTYLAKAEMKPCTWTPGTPGLWQWAEVTA